MKRGLKALNNVISPVVINSYNLFPDEKGTESLEQRYLACCY